MENYGSQDLEVLEGLEAVRLRPGMYIGTTGLKGLHHILWEIVDNSIDEVTNGYGNRIDIEINIDNSISVYDNGRGIPVDIHPKHNVSGVELVFTKLHAGGKFNNKNYGFSGGLHGVGAAVANALSRWLVVEVYKSGIKHTMKFHSIEKDGKIASGIIDEKMSQSPCDKKLKGTKVTFLPDDRVFGKEKVCYETVSKRIKELSFLNKGITMSLKDNRILGENGKPAYVEFCYNGGIADYVVYLNESKKPKYDSPIFVEKSSDKFYVAVSFQHTEDFSESIFSYVNNIPTTEGGTHETGFKTALTKTLNDYGRAKNIIKEKQNNFMGEDFREGMTAILNVKMQNVQFEGQTKTKLGNPEVKSLVENMLSEALKDYLNNARKDVIDAIFEKATMAAKARENAAKAKDSTRRINGMSSSALVGKLANCSGKDVSINELYIVEGDSAGGSAKTARDRYHQAILPVKGKPLNAEKKTYDEVLKNAELFSIINALGTGFSNTFDISGLKFDKVIILADADQDGAHIRAILLTFFFRYMRQLITDGHVYIGMPPLYKVETKTMTKYVYDDNALKEVLDVAGKNYNLQRYKGLGEMNPEQLWETTMDPKNRTLMRVGIEDAAEADRIVSILMGEDVPSRKQYIYDHADFNKEDKFKEII